MDEERPNTVMDRIRQYAVEVRSTQEQHMDVDAPNQRDVEARLDSTIRQLQDRLISRQLELDKLRASSQHQVPTAPSADPRERLIQLRAIKTAYEQMTPELPELPSPGSALPSLIAARTIQQTLSDTKSSTQAVQSQLESTERQIVREENQLSDSKLLTASLEARTAHLRTTLRDKAGLSSTAKAKSLMRAKQDRKQNFQRETNLLQKALDEFIQEQLAAMLAAEELGGPVVGELTDVDEDMLSAGFSSQGKPRSSKASTVASDSKKQTRIDEIWGHSQGLHVSEKDAAAGEVRDLIETLITTGGYVDLERDSAVARFLVRTKVAQFHPKDARRLRLIDFGRDFDD